MEPPKSCPHLEVKYYTQREFLIGSQGLKLKGTGWYCVWCKQEFAPVEGKDEKYGPQPKRAK
jgi:hypothetical protein